MTKSKQEPNDVEKTTTFYDENEQDTAESTVRIRPYQPSDLEQVRALFVEGMRINSAPESYIEESVLTDLADIEGTYHYTTPTPTTTAVKKRSRGMFFVMERISDQAVIGTLGLQELIVPEEPPTTATDNNNSSNNSSNNHHSNTPCSNMCELRRMSVHSSERRKRRGQLLVNHAVEYARQQSFQKIQLTTGAWMEAAIHFYLTNGFTDCGRETIPNYGVVTLAKFERIL